MVDMFAIGDELSLQQEQERGKVGAATAVL
jgi:hypothetical protein